MVSGCNELNYSSGLIISGFILSRKRIPGVDRLELEWWFHRPIRDPASPPSLAIILRSWLPFSRSQDGFWSSSCNMAFQAGGRAQEEAPSASSCVGRHISLPSQLHAHSGSVGLYLSVCAAFLQRRDIQAFAEGLFIFSLSTI